MQAVLRDRPISTPDEDDMTMVARRLLRGAVPADPWNDPASWPAWRQLLSHVPWLLDRAATYLVTRGEPRPARALFDRVYQLNRDMLGDDHPDSLNSASNLANTETTMSYPHEVAVAVDLLGATPGLSGLL